MKKPIILFFLTLLSITCIAQSYRREFDYDNSGNRIIRTIELPPEVVQPKSAFISNDNETSKFEDRIGEIVLYVFPNPTAGELTISIENYDDLTQGKLSLYTVNGQLIREVVVDSPTITLDLSSYSSGIYLLSLLMNNRVKDWKIVKQ
ncbi:T9SS type A sorting domain-containing protein [Bacteroidales bacterium OttesenSCG-928-B11]|nr:T9SS type A sorting domain-containing protein [Bacteroidales bacterium OttesenSCG-928-C03]MDL2313151.1 T9SS type A sorting domain-containing protein [Bacteroidales bacterium OttesenSCG-928-B11]MDL2325551.1 T9SS type A sorting domain-containing protein [Bacteroidales bacterium OttesenSCG-928-A14]